MFHKTTRGQSPGPLFPAPLSPCQRTLQWTRAISVHFLRAASKTNKQEPAQYLRKQLFLPLGVRNLHPPSPRHIHTSNTAARNAHSRTLTLWLKVTGHSNKILVLAGRTHAQTPNTFTNGCESAGHEGDESFPK